MVPFGERDLVRYAGCEKSPRLRLERVMQEEELDRCIRRFIENDDVAGMQALIDSHPTVVNRPAGSVQPLHLAAEEGKPRFVMLLIDRGGDVNSLNENGQTPLHLAAELHPEIVRLLLEHGADPNVYDEQGYTPMAWSISGQADEGAEAAKLLRDAGAQYGLLEATAMGDLETVESILRNDPGAMAGIPSQETLLSLAWGWSGQQQDRVAILKLLFEAGLQLPRDALETHADDAERCGRHELAGALRERADSAP